MILPTGYGLMGPWSLGLIVLAGLALGACASGSEWSKAGVSDTQIQREITSCKRIVRKYYFLGGSRFHRDVEEVDPVCMEAKGYSRKRQ